MPLHTAVLGASAGRADITVDARWAMAFAAGVPDLRPELYDTSVDLGVHPLLPVAVEWQVLIAHRSEESGLTADEVRRGIHVGHDLVLERPLRAAERLHVEGHTVAVGRRRAGATQTILFTATDDGGSVVWRTRHASLFLGVDLVGDAAETEVEWPATPTVPDLDRTTPRAVGSSVVRPIDAHLYSECARIWNPIHTDVVAARNAGLAAPILHGTATLARAVSIATHLADVPISDVRRVAGWFKAPVDLGTSFRVRLLARGERHLHFDVALDSGASAIVDGLVGW